MAANFKQRTIMFKFNNQNSVVKILEVCQTKKDLTKDDQHNRPASGKGTKIKSKIR